MSFLKKNQVIVYAIVLMLVVAGYLNYTTNNDNNYIQTSMQVEAKDDRQIANIGDATLVSSNDILETNSINNTKTEENQIIEEKNEKVEKVDNENSQNTIISSEIELTEQTSSNSQNDYFVKSKLERDSMYSQMIETYEKILNSNNSLETQKQIATQEITKINGTKNKIMICENLIKTKGFEESVIYVNDESISVILKTPELKPEQVAQVQNIISREMQAEIENIHISNK